MLLPCKLQVLFFYEDNGDGCHDDEDEDEDNDKLVTTMALIARA